MPIEKLLAESKNFVLIGEAGSGKTETALNLAVAMAKRGEKQVHFFDMDQTKPLFRARESAGELEQEGVCFHFQDQYLDAPVVASGVRERLCDPESIVLLDIGGGSHGSHMIGQFADLLNRDETKVLFLVNPYRPWSRSREDFNETVRRVLGTAGLEKLSLVANPNLGKKTTLADICEGWNRLRALLPEQKPEFLCALAEHAEAASAFCGVPVFSIRLNTLPDWLR